MRSLSRRLMVVAIFLGAAFSSVAWIIEHSVIGLTFMPTVYAAGGVAFVATVVVDTGARARRWSTSFAVVFTIVTFLAALGLAIYFVWLFNASTIHAVDLRTNRPQRYLRGQKYSADAVCWARRQKRKNEPGFTGDVAVDLENHLGGFVADYSEGPLQGDPPLKPYTDLDAVGARLSVAWLLLTAAWTLWLAPVAIRAGALRVFVSATTGDLQTFRDLAFDALLHHVHGNIRPVSQKYLPQDYRSVVDKLNREIRACDAVICLVGVLYGREPSQPPQGRRRSYTQLEFDIAKRLRKRVYVFLADETCPFDDAEKVKRQPPEERELQQRFREELKEQREKLDRATFSSHHDLEVKLLQINFNS
ncbi:MAG: DUF4062 domain-containing protein [Pirellulales bacterium]|nr:DUF4062 domain-containing protein [Pirellulales bacterium]